MLNEKGQCCGRKPLEYKREAHLFCPRCDRAYDSKSKQQIANWAWIKSSQGFFRNPMYQQAQPPLDKATQGER